MHEGVTTDDAAKAFADVELEPKANEAVGIDASCCTCDACSAATSGAKCIVVTSIPPGRTVSVA